MAPADEIGQFRTDMVPPDQSSFERLHEVVGLLERACESVDENFSLHHERVVAFAHVAGESAHKVDVRPGFHERTANDRLARGCGAGDDIRVGQAG